MRRYIHFHQQAFINENVMFIMRNLYNHKHSLALSDEHLPFANHKMKTFTSFTCKLKSLAAIIYMAFAEHRLE